MTDCIDSTSICFKNKNIKVDNLSCELRKIKQRACYLEEELIRTKKPEEVFQKFVGKSGKTIDALAIALKAATCNSNVLIRGESGTGKELIAEGIHYESRREFEPFIRVNCAAIPESLLESELFGHEKGAFTGAIKKKLGRFELANNGTIFLDEIGELKKSMQSKILRAIQEKEFQRVGGEETIKVDVRIIAATNRNLEEMVKKDEFREDLYYRLNVIPIYLPPLRERKEDITLLVEYFLNKFGEEKGFIIKGITNDALMKMLDYKWPGNVRELQNVVERMLALTDNEVINSDDLPIYIKYSDEFNKNKTNKNMMDIEQKMISRDVDSKLTFNEEFIKKIQKDELMPLDEYEKIIIEKALSKYGNYNRAAKVLGITHKTVAAKARKYGIEKKVIWK